MPYLSERLSTQRTSPSNIPCASGLYIAAHWAHSFLFEALLHSAGAFFYLCALPGYTFSQGQALKPLACCAHITLPPSSM